MLLLDEPAAGLNDAESQELGEIIVRLAHEWGLAVLLIEHDVSLVMATCDRIVALDFGAKLAEGTPAEISADPAVVAAYLGEPEPRAVTAASLLEVSGLRAGYGGVPVVHDLDLRVDPGEIVALLGPNGAGKTTTMLALSGVVPLMAGEVRLAGRPLVGPLHRRVRRGLSLVPEGRSVFMGLSTANQPRPRSRDTRRGARRPARARTAAGPSRRAAVGW